MKIATLSATVSVEGVAQSISRLDAFQEKLGKVSSAGEGLGRALGVAGAAYGAYAMGRSALEAAAQMESLQMALKSTLGGTKDLSAVTKDLAEIAKLPAINLEQAYMGFIQLKSAKLTTKEAEQGLIGIARAAAAVAATPEQFGRAMVALQQMANAPKPLQEELNQLREALPNAMALLDKAFGKSRAEDLAALGLTGKQVAMGFIATASAIPAVAGGIGNMMVNMEDSVRALNVSIGGLVAKFLEAFGPTIQANVAKLTDYFDQLSKNQGAVEALLKNIVAALAVGGIVVGISNVIKLAAAFVEVQKALKGIVIAEVIATALLDPKKAAVGAVAGLGIATGLGLGMNALMKSLFPDKPMAVQPPALPDVGGMPSTPGSVATRAAAVKSGGKNLNWAQTVTQAIIDAIKTEQKAGMDSSYSKLDQIEANTRSAADSLKLDRRIVGGGPIAQMGATASEIRAANMSAGSGYGVSSNSISGGNYIERHIRRTIMDEIRRSGGYAIPRG